MVGRPKGSKNKKHVRVSLVCTNCAKEFERFPSQLEKSIERGTKNYFCSNKCSIIGRDKSWSTTIQGDKHPLWNGGKGSYRERAIRYYGAVCRECGYDEYPSLLWVHHKDLKRTNHRLENLEVLCIRCHLEKHIDAGDLRGNRRAIRKFEAA